MPVKENHEIYSDEVQEILGHIPHWIIRWGIAIITLTILALLSASWIVKYPEIISGQITITSESPPIDIITRSVGRIHLLVEEGDTVVQGEVLGYIESSSNFTDMMRMGEAIGKISLDRSDEILSHLSQIKQLPSFSLGEVQPYYERVLSQIESLLLFYELNSHQTQIAQYQRRIHTYQELNQKLIDQRKTLFEEMEFTRNVFLSDSTLRTNDFISERDLNQSRLNYFQRRRNVEDAEIAILNNRSLISDYENRIHELTLEQHQRELELFSGLEESLQVLKSQVSLWKQTYLLQSPINGTVSLFHYLINNLFVQSGQEILTIIPDRPGIFGIVHIPVTGSGRVKINQQINISLQNYPAQEYGRILGVVDQISSVPRENAYSIRVQLPDGLQTSYGRNLDFRPQMQGTADIVTEELRLLERVFYQFKSLIDQAG